MCPEFAILSRENPLEPSRGTNLPTEIACYSLPYGGVGFASHILTYYTIICLGFGRTPFLPCKPVRNGKWGLVLAVAGLLAGFILSTLTMVRCRNHWQLLAMAVWKFSMSLFNGIVGIHVAAQNYAETKDQSENEGGQRDEGPKYRPWVFGWFAICRSIYIFPDQQYSDNCHFQTFPE